MNQKTTGEIYRPAADLLHDYVVEVDKQTNKATDRQTDKQTQTQTKKQEAETKNKNKQTNKLTFDTVCHVAAPHGIGCIDGLLELTCLH